MGPCHRCNLGCQRVRSAVPVGLACSGQPASTHILPRTPDSGRVLLQLGYRFAHILRRMLPIAMYLLQKDGQFLNGHDLFLKRVGASFHAFIDESEKVKSWVCLACPHLVAHAYIKNASQSALPLQ